MAAADTEIASGNRNSPQLHSFLSGANAEYIAHLYARYMRNPQNVDASWRDFFASLNDDETALLIELHGASWTPEENRKDRNGFQVISGGAALEAEYEEDPEQETPRMDTARMQEATRDSIRALMLIRAYRARGHLVANLDPLQLRESKPHPELEPKHYGFSESDMNKPIYIGGVLGLEAATLEQILEVLKETYCGQIGVEFLHLSDPEQKSWIQARIEAPRNQTEFTDRGKRAIYQRLTAAEDFEKFLHAKYPGTKRFGLDGGESLIPAIEQIMKRGGQLGLEEIVLGMAHRGRLNVLANVMGKPFTAIFSEFQGKSAHPEDVQGSGDVKYHLGTSADRDFDGNTIHLSLTANPSHLEAVDPVVIGKVRAKQNLRADPNKDRAVMPMLLHGDAAFAGQGLVAETLMISDLPGYRVGGTVHIVINNQIGFTTMPRFARSGPYPTDVAKMLAAPIFHVNGDDPEAVVHVARIATEFRQEFGVDVVIDMICYRRFGHNEGDEPSFTQPLMYKKIREHESARDQYGSRLVAEGTITEEEEEQIRGEFRDCLEEAFEAAENYKPNEADWLQGVWSGLESAGEGTQKGETGIDQDMMNNLHEALTTWPQDFNIHSKLKRLMETKSKMFETGSGFDWATAEAMAFGSLLAEGTPVRLSGQDSRRGTFSQRHSILYDQVTEAKYYPLRHVKPDQAFFEAHDSPLSEAGVLGFEYGFSQADPHTLVLWEAQFGDFVNGAQVIIDQFISSAESKWLRMSGLVMLLPHGYEGQGPEHSSARPERFLQNAAEDNWQLVNCTTPANYFHALRRQIRRKFRKPLIVLTPKSLLRHKLCVSDAAEFMGEETFHRILPGTDKLAAPSKIKRVVLCTGKVYYDLLETRREREIQDVALVRLEQLYPFPAESLGAELKKYPNAEIVWCQEEPENMGYWRHLDRRIERVLTDLKHKAARPVFVGRHEAASPATGIHSRHVAEQKALIDEALTL